MAHFLESFRTSQALNFSALGSIFIRVIFQGHFLVGFLDFILIGTTLVSHDGNAVGSQVLIPESRKTALHKVNIIQGSDWHTLVAELPLTVFHQPTVAEPA